jgi:hypothetical protein
VRERTAFPNFSRNLKNFRILTMDVFIISERHREWLKGDPLTVLFCSRARTSAARISSSFAGANVLASSVLLLISMIASISLSWESCDAYACIKCVLANPQKLVTNVESLSVVARLHSMASFSIFIRRETRDIWAALFRGGQLSASQQKFGHPVCS